MTKELQILNDIYSLPDKKGKQKLIKRNVISRMLINTEDIRFVEEVINKKGNIIKGICSIKVDSELIRVKHDFNDIKKLVGHTNTMSQIGFKYK